MRTRRRGSNVAGADLLQQVQDLAAIVGQVVHALEEALLQCRTTRLVELADASGFGIEFEEFEAEQRREDVEELSRHLLFGDSRLEHLVVSTRSQVPIGGCLTCSSDTPK